MPVLEPIHFKRAPSRSRTVNAVELPAITRRFLRTTRGRRARAKVETLHRWIERHHLTIAELAPDRRMLQEALKKKP